MIGHELEIELVDGVLDAVVPPAQIGERGFFQLLLGEGALRRQHRHAQTEERSIAVFHGPPPSKGPVAEQAPFHALVEALELDVGGRTPTRGAGAGRLIDLQVSNGVLAQTIPIAIDEPGRADHGARLMPGPEPGDKAAAQLVAVLIEHPRKLEDTGIAGGVVGRLWPQPGILVAADHDKILAAAGNFADGDLHGAPGVFDVGAHADADRTLFQQLAQLEAGGPGDADAGQPRHFRLQGLRRRIAPHGLDRAEGHRRVLRMTPVHHHAPGGAHEGGDALLFVAGRMIGELGKRDLAGGVKARVFAKGPRRHVQQLAGKAVGQGRQAVAQGIGLDHELHRCQNAQLALFGKTDEPGHFQHRRRYPILGERRGAVLGHALAVGGARQTRGDLGGDVLDVGLDVGGRHGADDVFFRHLVPRHPSPSFAFCNSRPQGQHLAAN